MPGQWVDLGGGWVRARVVAARDLVGRLQGFNAVAAERAVLESEFFRLRVALEMLMDELERHVLPYPGSRP